MNKVLHKICFLNGNWNGRFLKATAFGLLTCRSESDLYLKSTIVADGGLRHMPKAKLDSLDFVWIGDGDSTKSFKPLEKLDPSKQIRLDADKDLSDFAAVLDYIVSGQPLSNYSAVLVEVLGGLGGERAHELVNILESCKFIDALSFNGAIVFHSQAIITSGPIQISTEKGSRFSILCPEIPPKEVFISGARFQGTIALKRPSHGLNNIATSDVLDIKPSGTVLIIFND